MALTKSNQFVVTIFCDASFCPKTRAAGWGFWIKTDLHERQGGGAMEVQPADASEAELLAVVNSLFYAVSQGIAVENSRVVFGLDNQWVVHLLNGSTTLKGREKEKPLCFEALGLIKEFRRKLKLDLRFRKVKAHNPNGGGRCRVNEVADKHAKIGMKKARAERKVG